MPRWLLRSVVALAACACVLALASVWLLSAPSRGEAARREAALALWQRTRPQHYMIKARLISMQGGETLLLEVDGEQLVAGWSGNGSAALSAGDLKRLDAYFPIERLFVLAQREERRGDWRSLLTAALPVVGRWVGAPCPLRRPFATRYDGRHGYPSRMLVGVSRCALNTDGVEVRVDDVRSLP